MCSGCAMERIASLAAVMSVSGGTALQGLDLKLDSKTGAQTRFQLPENAVAGGYELRFVYRDQQYSSAFRVAEYIKPHFEISLDLTKADFRTGEPVKGNLVLLYPDGKPVANARLQLSLRAQQLSMVDNELQYLGQFPVELTSSELGTDAQGRAALELATARAKGGMSDQLPVLQSQRALFALQRERAASDAALALRLLAVCKAAGLAPQA